MFKVYVTPAQFGKEGAVLLDDGELRVEASRYRTGIESLKLINARGFVEVLPFMGQIIWNAEFDGVSLRMKNMFTQPHPAKEITETYGCFAFHSGLLAAGTPAPEDTHQMHGEFPTSRMDRAWIEVDGDTLRVVSEYEYVKGFGDHYVARPSVTLMRGAGRFTIGMSVTNLSEYQPMPLQYMCHMNYAFVPGGVMSQSFPDEAFGLRRTIPAHVHPTPAWTKLNQDILDGKVDKNSLASATSFDPEIVYMADDLPQYGETAECRLARPDGVTFVTHFSTVEFPVATRWILFNPDQQVAAFVLPGTSRPEGFLAAKKAGTLIYLKPGETRTFHVDTGIEDK